MTEAQREAREAAHAEVQLVESVEEAVGPYFRALGHDPAPVVYLAIASRLAAWHVAIEEEAAAMTEAGGPTETETPQTDVALEDLRALLAIAIATARAQGRESVPLRPDDALALLLAIPRPGADGLDVENERLREGLQAIVDHPTVVPDHPHGGIHPPYLEWTKVAEIARAALSRSGDAVMFAAAGGAAEEE